MTNRKPKKATAAPLPSAAPSPRPTPSRKRATRKAPPRPAPATPDFRALPLFEKLSPEHITFLVQDEGSAPHLKPGECAVVDLSNREPQSGELYVIQWNVTRSIKQFRLRPWHGTQAWNVGDLAGFREEGGIWRGISEGPLWTERQIEYLKSRTIGRVVGFALSPLGDLLAPAAEVAPPPAARQAQASAAGGDMPDCLQRWIDSDVVRDEPRDQQRG